jgi:hypothetical protein
MSIYISWSGIKSRMFAESVAHLFSKVIPEIEIINSESDLAMGAKWGTKQIESTIQAAAAFLVLVTLDNQNKPWLNYEFGFIASQKRLVIPYLLDIKPNELHMPIAQYQAVVADKEGTKALIRQLATHDSNRQEPTNTDNGVELYWPMFEAQLREIRNTSAGGVDLAVAIGDTNIQIGTTEIINSETPIEIRNIIERASPSIPVRRPKEISADQAFERINAAVRQNLNQLEQNVGQARLESSNMFKLTIIFASIGFGVLMVGVVLLLFNLAAAGVVASAASIIPAATSGLFFAKDKEVRNILTEYHDRILENQKIMTMIDICETLSVVKDRDKMKERIILNALYIA